MVSTRVYVKFISQTNIKFLLKSTNSQWNLLHEDYKVAKEYIEDIRDICDNFEALCQRNLAANTGKILMCGLIT